VIRAIRRRLEDSAGGDQGVALVVVIGIGMLMLMLVATALTVAVSGLKRTDTDQDFNGAMDAAYAGVAEYQSRLAMDTSYYTYGNKDAPFSVASGSTKLSAPPVANPAFGIGASGSWATVPGSTPVASFRYEVDSSKYAANGTIRIRSTGRVGSITRSVVADLKQSGFIDFLYFTDYEVQDPEITGKPECAKHLWEGRSSGCEQIQFATGDVIAGPAHSNDTFKICSARFEGKVTTSNTKTPLFVQPSGCTPVFKAEPKRPEYHPQITMPPSNAEMKKETRNDLKDSDVPLPGCLYTGPTVITFTSNGKMNIKSPWTKKTQIAAIAANSTAPDACGVPGTGSGRLGSPEGATINVLPANVIYVQNVPTLAGDPNLPTGTGMPSTSFKCVNSDTGWTLGAGTSNVTQYPAIGEIGLTGTPPYGCKSGDVFVEGTFAGAMTIAAENYVFVTDNLSYADTTRDILGLVGNNAVWVWNPMKSVTTTVGSGWYQYTTTETKPLLTDTSRTIHAAILSVAHTFQVQNFNFGGSRGTLTVRGSIAQAFRGPVGQTLSNGGSNGYLKAYQYDTRFAYTAPPKFLSPVSSSYGVSQYAGVAAAFGPTGAAK